MKISVIGAGNWGSAIALILAKKGYNIGIWTNEEDVYNQMISDSENKKYLPGIKLPANIKAFYDMQQSMDCAETVVLAIPSSALRIVLQDVKKYLKSGQLLINVGKGLEDNSGLRGSQVITAVLGEELGKSAVILSGPNLAVELANEIPTATIASSINIESAKKAQEIFMTPALRVYTNPDIIGVELGGSLKNIIAIGAGIAVGLGYGDNTKATIATRGLKEMVRLGEFLGANPQTFYGLSGIGDLITTCASPLSRNNRLGQMLAKGFSLEESLSKLGQVAEGVHSCQAAYKLSNEKDIYMPITHEIYAILFQNKPAKQAVNDLMSRVGKEELH